MLFKFLYVFPPQSIFLTAGIHLASFPAVDDTATVRDVGCNFLSYAVFQIFQGRCTSPLKKFYFTVTFIFFVTFPDFTVMIAVPFFFALMTPFVETDATFLLEVL